MQDDQKSEARFRLLVEGSEAIFFYVLDLEGRITYVSPAVESVTGYAVEDFLGRPYTSLGSRGLDGREAARRHIAERITEWVRGEGRPLALSTELRHRDGHLLTLELVESVMRREGAVVGIQGYARDVTPQRRLEHQLRHYALHDPLTGLPNRALFDDRLMHTVQLAQRRATRRFAVLALDLDRFTLVNDTRGRGVGDRVLAAVARRVAQCVRPGDTVARTGGDELAILLDEIRDPDDATRVADRIIAELAAPLVLDAHELTPSASIGIALSTTGYEGPEDLTRNAGTALYYAKARGRGRYEVFDRAMRERSLARVRLETALRRIAARTDWKVAYQAVVDLRTGRIVGFEALARWPHDGGGALTPEELVAVAEGAGIIADLDRWMLTAACRQLAAWQARCPVRPLAMHVNVSGALLVQPGFVDAIRAVLEETRVAPAALGLEVTEAALETRAATARAVLDQLRELGVRLTLDDFGAGSAPLAHLSRFPFDGLKLARSLVRDDAAAAKLVRAVVALAHNLELAVVAEGVERAEQLDRLRALGCEYAQGFHLSRPVDAAAAGALLEHDPRW